MKPILLLSLWVLLTGHSHSVEHSVSGKTDCAQKSPVEKDRWGKTTRKEAAFYAASDVADSQVKLTKKWYQIAASAWGNYGPLEFWVVGQDEQAAAELDKRYCDIRKQKEHLSFLMLSHT